MLDRPSQLLRLEDTTLFLATLILYQYLHGSWLHFALFFFIPDLFMLGFLLDSRIGATIYNLAHTLTLPILLFLAASWRHRLLTEPIAVIWAAHIAFDRLLGYGLKYPTGFKDTHLQRLA
ncbi:DUF4260 domain-containing protein [Granulicella sibirica]|uniref:DUF4260 domain-containing protein n=1 Tax=Granulicella sibirica TaxID=2479048 RepID=A0A4Q0SW65_9BACT|nr:DUF4260 domain-containing protein [Granulicella sibirica]RXH55355.1 hypothetical protein GRAN_4459 [Granulicella sibirica]